MAKKILHVNIADKIATYQKRDGVIVCGNSDYEIVFAFDSEWDEYETKIARFIWNGRHTDVKIEDNTCPVPKLRNTEELTIGVYAEDIATTTPAKIDCVRSVLCGDEPLTEADENYTSEAEVAAIFANESANSAKASATEAAESATQAKGYMEVTQEIATDYENIDARITRNSKRLSNLEKGIVSLPYETDSTVARVKVVPENALSYALLQKVGGMSYAGDFAGLRTAAVTGVITTGTNLFADGDVYVTGNQNVPLILTAGTYTISCNVSSTDTDSNSRRILLRNDAGNNVISLFLTEGANTKTFTISEDVTQAAFSAAGSSSASAGDTAVYSNIMLNKGTAAVPYEPYKVLTNFPIPAEVQSLDGYGLGVNADYNNHISWDDDGKAKWNVMVRRKVFDGTETFALIVNPNDISEFAYRLTGDNSTFDNGNMILCVSNHYEAVSREYSYYNAGTMISVNNSYIRIQDSEVTTVAEMKAKLAAWYAEGNPLIVDYIIATPVVTDISDLITPDNIIEVTGNGVIEFKNQYNLAPASTVTYQTKEEAV